MLDKATLRLYINKECAILISGGGWVEGVLKPIVNEIANLMPTASDAAAFGLGMTAVHINDIVAIRQIKPPPPPKQVIVDKPAQPSKKYTLDDQPQSTIGTLPKNGNANAKE